MIRSVRNDPGLLVIPICLSLMVGLVVLGSHNGRQFAEDLAAALQAGECRPVIVRSNGADEYVCRDGARYIGGRAVIDRYGPR